MKKLAFFIIFYIFFLLSVSSMKVFADGTSVSAAPNSNATAQEFNTKIFKVLAKIQEGKTQEQKQPAIAQNKPNSSVNTTNKNNQNNVGAGALNGFGNIMSNQPIHKPKNIKDALNVYCKTGNFKALLSVFIKHPKQASKLTTNSSILHLIANSRKQDDMTVAKIVYIAFKYNNRLNPNYQGTVIINPQYKKRCQVFTTSIHWVTPIFMAAINNLKVVYKVLVSYKANQNITSIIHHNKVFNANTLFGVRVTPSCSYVTYKTTLSAEEAKLDISLNHGVELNYKWTTGPKGTLIGNVFRAPSTWNFNR